MNLTGIVMFKRAAIELSGCYPKSHERPDRRERDAFVDGVFAAAKLPLLHVPVRRSYAMAELEALLAPHLGTTRAQVQKISIEKPAQANPSNNVRQAQVTMMCPKCGGEMVLRTAKSGANAGSKFWGCSNFPRCRTMLPYEAQQA
ncbi:MAG: topoisomerase DNA-binding C4 zinc finger domain-containing protein [Chloroflexota bacterium]|nr:MAG: hypothetical protein DIU68_16505 [Chloroflexota bacterium]